MSCAYFFLTSSDSGSLATSRIVASRSLLSVERSRPLVASLETMASTNFSSMACRRLCSKASLCPIALFRSRKIGSGPVFRSSTRHFPSSSVCTKPGPPARCGQSSRKISATTCCLFPSPVLSWTALEENSGMVMAVFTLRSELSSLFPVQ